MNSTQDTNRLIKDALAGERAAWSTLYHQHYPFVYATALAICGNTSVAREAVQETFITAFLKLYQLKK